MANGTSAAVTEAARLNEIGFPEFTAKLITDTFDALVSANMRQTEAYIELLTKVSKTLTEFIDETKDDIGGDQLLQFLARVVPDRESAIGTKVSKGGSLSAPEATTINNAVAIAEVDPVPVPTVATAGPLDDDKFKAILDAVAKRIAADKYTLLKEMVKMGLLRLVVEHGVIETRLTFNTYGSTFYEHNANSYHRGEYSFRAKAQTGGLLSAWIKASASPSYRSVSVSTTSEKNRDISGSQVQIYGRVQIDFKTDYQPLSS
jgi:hypothetical protein